MHLFYVDLNGSEHVGQRSAAKR